MQKSDIWMRITSLYGSQTSPVVLWMQNSVLRSRKTLVYWSLPSSVVLCIQISTFSIRITGLHESQPSFVAFACKTTTLGLELQVSMCPRPHLCSFAIKRAIRAPLSLWVPALIRGFFIHNSDSMTTINSLCVAQTSPVVLWVYGSHRDLLFLA